MNVVRLDHRGLFPLARLVVGASLGGAALGLADVLLLASQGTIALHTVEWWFLSAVSVLIALTTSLVLALPLAVLRVPRRAAIGVGGFLFVGGLLADAFVLPRLYPWLHVGFAVAATLGVGMLGAALCNDRVARAALPGALVAVVLTPLAVSGLFGRHSVRSAAIQGTRITSHVLSVWPLSRGAAPSGRLCTWPPPSRRAARALAEGRPVLLLTVDAMRADLGGDRFAQTMPRTARRMAGAFHFRRAYSAAPRTNESVSSLLRGRYPAHLRFDPVSVDAQDRFYLRDEDRHDWRRRYPCPVHDGSPTLAQELKAAGYATHAAADYVYFQRPCGVVRGFATVDTSPYQRFNRDNDGITSEALADALVAFLQRPEARGRFFLWAHFLDPHAPYRPYGDVPHGADARSLQLAELRRVDDAFERVFETLSTLGLSERAIVAVTSDHGEEFGEHGGAFHGTTLFDEQVRVPLWMKVPGLSGREVDDTVSLVDVMPTLLELTTGRVPAGVDGESLVPALAGERMPARPILLRSTLHREIHGVVEGTHKLIVATNPAEVALYDLQRDPGETRNRADEDPATTARLRCLLRAATATSVETPAGRAATSAR